MTKNGNRPDPYQKCPVYESESFLLRLLSTDDAKDLFECYNGDMITSDNNTEKVFHFSTIEKARECIKSWLREYERRYYTRFAILDKQMGQVVGTIEIFDYGEKEIGHSVLRIDILSQYENEKHLSEILRIADQFFNDFRCSTIVTKAMPEATKRINALMRNGYDSFPKSPAWKREHYFIKRSPQNES